MAKYVNEMNLYPLDGQYVAQINVPNGSASTSHFKTETVIILDRSGSMGDAVERIVRQVLPKFFKNLQCQDNDSFHLIAFDDEVEYYEVKISELSTFDMYARDGTYMYETVKKLSELFEVFHQKQVELLRILTISDGEISDTEDTIRAADRLATFVKKFNISVNSQAVRWYGKADTTALCCLLQLNNVTKSNLVESCYEEGVDATAKIWADLFAGDKLMTDLVLKGDKDIFLKNPWDTEATNNLRLQSGENVFWCKEKPTDLKIDTKSVKKTVNTSITYEKLQQLLYERIDVVIDHMKMLKIIESSSAQETMKLILDYFKRIEKEVPPTGAEGFKFSDIIESILKDEKVKHLSDAEKAEYLKESVFVKKEFSSHTRQARSVNESDNLKEFDDLIKEISDKFQNFGISLGVDNSALSVRNLFLLAFLVMLMILVLVIRKTLRTLTAEVKNM
ncbi:uncharacterized protein LOC119077886 [Bradysia coprophila]|uniref:uncharacterized protein LOC119077886 n=1 Tax=Bradysia coprophila TaxID=38358 RepID=UPI00187D9A24|nr:uncharacterized protein LOC119077886 [Bradysia coprophila]XP_037041146.1 uncharacterized protein LOC119077886 [Bradysia coprophila]